MSPIVDVYLSRVLMTAHNSALGTVCRPGHLEIRAAHDDRSSEATKAAEAAMSKRENGDVPAVPSVPHLPVELSRWWKGPMLWTTVSRSLIQGVGGESMAEGIRPLK